MTARSNESPNEESAAERWARKAEESAKEYQKFLKKLHPAEMEDRREWASYLALVKEHYWPGDFPLELVANIASRLLRGENYSEAVIRALKLLRECDHKLKGVKEGRKSLYAAWQNAIDLSSDYDVPEGVFKIPLPVAIKIITDQERGDRAESDYLSFLKATNPCADTAELSAIWKKQERDGIDAALTRKLTRQFAQLRDEGKLDKRRPPKKSSRQHKKSKT
jgi:hypothetical protein